MLKEDVPIFKNTKYILEITYSCSQTLILKVVQGTWLMPPPIKALGGKGVQVTVG